MGASQSNYGDRMTSYAYNDVTRNQDAKIKKSKAKPAPPQKPRVIGSTNTTLTLTWSPPRYNQGHVIIAYSVEMLLLDDHKIWKTLTKSCQGNTFTAKNLQPGNSYLFRIRAENIFGIGKASPRSEPAQTQIYDTGSLFSSYPNSNDVKGHVISDLYDYRDSADGSKSVVADNISEDTSCDVNENSTAKCNFRRRHSFNMHLDGGVSNILYKSDLHINKRAHQIDYPLYQSTRDKRSYSQTLCRTGFERNSFSTNRKISLPIVLAGTGTNSLNRLRESRASIKSVSSDIASFRNSISKAKNRGSRNSLGSDTNTSTNTSTNSNEESKQKRESRSSIQSCLSDMTLSNSKDSSVSEESRPDSLCESILDQDKTPEPEHSDVSKLTKHIQKIELTENKLKFHDLREKWKLKTSNLDKNIQKDYYNTLRNPWEKGSAPSCASDSDRDFSSISDDVKTMYKSLTPEVFESNSPADDTTNFRTLRSYLQSSNIIVKTSRNISDVVGVVLDEDGVSRTITRGKLQTIADADEDSEDTIRVTSL